MICLKLSDFTFERNDKAIGFVSLWGKPEVEIQLDMETNGNGSVVTDTSWLATVIERVNGDLNWIENNRKAFVDCLAEDNCLEMIEEYCFDDEYVNIRLPEHSNFQKEDIVSIVDGKAVYTNKAWEIFAESLLFELIIFAFNKDEEVLEQGISLGFRMNPDLIGGHSFDMGVSVDKEVSNYGLIG